MKSLPSMLVGAALCGFAASQAEAAPADANFISAQQVLKSMSTYMGAQKNLAVTYDATLEIVTPEIEKIQFSASGTAQISRPDKLRLIRHGGYSNVELDFDGKTTTIIDQMNNEYAQIPTPETADKLIDELSDRYGINLPAGDLLLTDSFQALMADVINAKHVGRGIVNGAECDHLAFRNGDTDWQIWVRAGPEPLPCKFVITSKTVAAAPEYTIVFHDWSTNSNDQGVFTFKPRAGAKSVPFAQLQNIGELPPPAPFK